MTIKEKMLERRQQARNQIEADLQREVDKVDSFTEKLQESDPFSTEFSFPIYESSEFDLEVFNKGGETLFFNLRNQINMKPQGFRRFLEERLQEEGIELKENQLKISLL